MKIRIVAVLLSTLLLFVGCSAGAVENRLDAAENAVEHGLDAMESTMENAVAPTKSGNIIPSAAAITREQAVSIALEKAGFTENQVTQLRTEYEIDDGIPRYEIQFRQGRWEYDYEINANTGDILSYDKDD